MEVLITWLPRIGAAIMLLFGLIGLFRPRLILDTMNIALQSPTAFSEARAVFGGLNFGMAVAALTLGEPAIFTALGITWGVMTLARFWSLAVDGIGIKAAVPGVVVDGTLSFLFLSPLLLG